MTIVRNSAKRATRVWRSAGTGKALVGLMSATIWAQAINLAATPILARLYGPHAYGTYAFVFAVVSVASAVAAFRLEWAIVLPSTETGARSVATTAIFVALLLAAVSQVGIFVFHPLIARSLGRQTYEAMLWAPIMTFTLAVISVLTQCALREKNFESVSTQTALAATATVILQIGASLLSRSPQCLLGGQTLGRLSATTRLLRLNKKYVGIPRDVQQTLRHYWRFPVVFMPSSLLNVLGTNLPLIMITSVAGATSAGQLGLAQAIVLLPSTIIGTAVGQIFLAQLGDSVRNGTGDARRQYLSVSKKLSLIALPVALIITIAAPPILPAVLGQGWSPVGSFARAMGICVAIGFVVSPLTFVYIAFQRTRESLWVDLSRVVLVGGAGLIAYRYGMSAAGFVWVMYAGQTINYIITWYIGLRIVTSHERLRVASDDNVVV